MQQRGVKMEDEKGLFLEQGNEKFENIKKRLNELKIKDDFLILEQIKSLGKELYDLLEKTDSLLSVKQQLLRKYSNKEPNVFYQFDGFENMKNDSIAKPDEDGLAVFYTNTCELMNGSTVRVLLKPGVEKKETYLKLLKRIYDWIERDDYSEDGFMCSIVHPLE